MTMNELKEALKDEALQKEFVAFLAEQKPETKEAAAKALYDFAVAKGFVVSEEEQPAQALSMDELGEAAGGSGSGSAFVDSRALTSELSAGTPRVDERSGLRVDTRAALGRLRVFGLTAEARQEYMDLMGQIVLNVLKDPLNSLETIRKMF